LAYRQGRFPRVFCRARYTCGFYDWLAVVCLSRPKRETEPLSLRADAVSASRRPGRCATLVRAIPPFSARRA
jgi:hypothetical protein